MSTTFVFTDLEIDARLRPSEAKRDVVPGELTLKVKYEVHGAAGAAIRQDAPTSPALLRKLAELLEAQADKAFEVAH